MADATVSSKRSAPSAVSVESGMPVVGQWFVNLGTGHAVTVDRALVRSVAPFSIFRY